MIHALETDGHARRSTSAPTPMRPSTTLTPPSRPALAVREGRADAGVLICGSGAGVAIAANKIRGVRAALCHDLFTARQSREDDDANVICLGSRVVDVDFAITLTPHVPGRALLRRRAAPPPAREGAGARARGASAMTTTRSPKPR